MADVLNPEQTESITLSTEMDTLTLDAATEQAEPSTEYASNPEAESQEIAALSSLHAVADSRAIEPETETTAAAAAVAEFKTPVGEDADSSSMEDFAAALESFDREQAAEAAALAFDDNIVTGTVIKLTDKHVVVDVGLKSEGLIPLEQVLDHTGQPKLKAGDTVEVVVEREEQEGGYLLSFEKAQRRRIWDVVEKAAAEKIAVTGIVLGRVKGGLTVDIGIKAFLPGSQLEVRPVRNLDAYLGQQIEVRVIKLNKKRGNVVVSRKEILEDRLRRVCRPGRHRRPAPHHRYVLGTPNSSPRPGKCWRRDSGEGAEVRQREAAGFVGIQAVDPRPVARCG